MISLSALAALAQTHQADLDVPVASLHIGDRVFLSEGPALLWGYVNLSHDFTYRESIATLTDSAIRKGRVLAAQGADLIDMGAGVEHRQGTSGQPATADRLPHTGGLGALGGFVIPPVMGVVTGMVGGPPGTPAGSCRSPP